MGVPGVRYSVALVNGTGWKHRLIGQFVFERTLLYRPDAVTPFARESAGACATQWLARTHGLDGEPFLRCPVRR